MAQNRTCFIISPIGEKDSDVRKHADNLIKRVISPALAGHNFDCIRIDQSYTNARITDEIVNLIKNSELCIVDSSGNNANVMYELGRRHEIDRPLILLRPLGQSIVFDIKDMKHVEYDLESVDSVIDTQNHIRGFLEEYDRQGFISPRASANFDSIAENINRLERRIEDLARALFSGPKSAVLTSLPVAGAPSDRTAQVITNLGLDRGLEFCIGQNWVREAEEIYDMLAPQLSKDLVVLMLMRMSSIGSRSAFQHLGQEFIPALAGLEYNDMKIVVSGYVHGAVRFNEEKNALAALEPILEGDILVRADISRNDKAFFVNQIGKLYSGVGETEKAREYYERARDLNPNETAFLYNAATSAHSLGDLIVAERLADKLVDRYIDPDQGKPEIVDYDHLSAAYGIYVSSGKPDKAASALRLIREGNPMLANYLTRS